MKMLKNTAHKTLVYISIFGLVVLNLSGVVQCSGMLIKDNCCHTQNLVKPCCVKNLKVTVNERITSNCGCSMKEAPQNPDLYNDFSSYQNRTPVQNFSFSVLNYETFSASVFAFESVNHSPPVFYASETYLTNMNLRI